MANEQKIEDELVIANLNLLKVCLLNFITKKFNVCDTFITEFNNCVNDDEIKKLLIKYGDDIFERLGGDPDLKYEVDKLELKISSLEWDIEELKFKLEELIINLGNSLHNDYKVNFFYEYQDNYTPWELEELLKNGKKYLNK